MEAGVSLLKGASVEASFALLENDIEKTPWRTQRHFLDYKVEVMLRVIYFKSMSSVPRGFVFIIDEIWTESTFDQLFSSQIYSAPLLGFKRHAA